jgi:hypothetical protein
MKKVLLVCVVLSALASHVWADGFAEAADAFDEEEQRREEIRAGEAQISDEKRAEDEDKRRQEIEVQNLKKQKLIDGGWDNALIHASAFGMFGENGGGGGLSLDWQPFRNFAWTFIDIDFFSGWFNISTLLTATWRPYSFEVAVFAGPTIGLTIVSAGPPEIHGESYSYATEKLSTLFSLMVGVHVGYHLGPGIIYAGVKYSDVHEVAFGIGYKFIVESR